MRSLSMVVMFALISSACSLPGASAEAGYALLSLSGDIGLSDTGGGSFVDQDISEFGLGGDQGSPYARAQFDLGMPVLAVKGFVFEQEGSGTLVDPFGSIDPGTVTSKMTLTNIQGSLAFEFGLGPISLAPGIAVEYIDLDFSAQPLSLPAETIDWQVPIPMGFLRAEADLWLLQGAAELGYIQIPEIQGVEGTFWDLDVTVSYRPTPLVHLFTGYRHVHVDANGESDGQNFDTNLDLAGWVIGGGFSF